MEYQDGAQPSPFVVATGRPTSKLVTTKTPPSALLARVGAFLPMMERANKELEERVAKNENVDVESVRAVREERICTPSRSRPRARVQVPEGADYVEFDVAIGPVRDGFDQLE